MATLHALPVIPVSATPIPSSVQTRDAEARVQLVLSRLDQATR